MKIEDIPTPNHFLPVGSTDSEKAFCWLLSELEEHCSKEMSADGLADFLAPKLEHLNSKGVFNMLLSNGKYLITFCSTKLSWIMRKSPFGEAHLQDDDITIDFAKETTQQDIVTIIATEPLTDNEAWNTMQGGELQIFEDGLPTVKVLTHPYEHPKANEQT